MLQHFYKSLLLLLLIIFSLPISISQAASSQLFVRVDGDDNTCNGTVDADSSQAPNCAFLTIQKGVSSIANGGSIQVGAGNFQGQITINKPLVLKGAQAGNDARTRQVPASSESILGDPFFNLSIQSNDVTVDGFIFENSTSDNLGTSVFISPPNTGGLVFVNNIIQHNQIGLYPSSSVGASLSRIQFNLFRDQDDPTGGAAGAAIYTDFGLDNYLIDSNSFINNQLNCAINLVGVSANNSFSINTTISNNLFDGNGAGACTSTSRNIQIIHNTMLNNIYRAIVLNGDAQNILIQGNQMLNNGFGHPQNIGNAIVIRDINGDPIPLGPNKDITIRQNNIVGNKSGVWARAGGITGFLQMDANRIFDNEDFGFNNEEASLVADVQNNWWGCNAGPLDLAGGCDLVQGSADANPWVLLRLIPDATNIFTGGSVGLQSDLTQNSEGQTLPHPLVDNIPTSFATSLGVVNPSSTIANAGIAHSNFTAPAATGTATLSTTVDNQTISLDINFQNPITPPPPGPPALSLQGSGSSCSFNEAVFFSSGSSFSAWAFLSILLIHIKMRVRRK